MQPAEVGLPAHGRRRTKGLRREELAELAGISVDYLIRLEQGRADAPSAQVLSSLARALRLTGDESDHLHRLAGVMPARRAAMSVQLTPSLQRLIQRLDDVAVSVRDASWTMVAWNSTWSALMGHPESAQPRERNILWRHFTGVPCRIIRSPEENASFEESAVADLRAAIGRYPDDVSLQSLVADLCEASVRFSELWKNHCVGSYRPRRNLIDHPKVGQLAVDCDVFTVEDGALRVVVQSVHPSSSDAKRFDVVRQLRQRGWQEEIG